MDTEQFDSGSVVEVLGDKVKVELKRGEGCKSCTMQGFCFSKSKPAIFLLDAPFALKAGDRVELDISAAGRVFASLLIFGMPVLFLFAGFLIANLWFEELPSIGFAFAAMALSFLLLRYCDKRLGKKINVSIVRKIEDTLE